MGDTGDTDGEGIHRGSSDPLIGDLGVIVRERGLVRSRAATAEEFSPPTSLPLLPCADVAPAEALVGVEMMSALTPPSLSPPLSAPLWSSGSITLKLTSSQLATSLTLLSSMLKRRVLGMVKSLLFFPMPRGFLRVGVRGEEGLEAGDASCSSYPAVKKRNGENGQEKRRGKEGAVGGKEEGRGGKRNEEEGKIQKIRTLKSNTRTGKSDKKQFYIRL